MASSWALIRWVARCVISIRLASTADSIRHGLLVSRNNRACAQHLFPNMQKHHCLWPCSIVHHCNVVIARPQPRLEGSSTPGWNSQPDNKPLVAFSHKGEQAMQHRLVTGCPRVSCRAVSVVSCSWVRDLWNVLLANAEFAFCAGGGPVDKGTSFERSDL